MIDRREYPEEIKQVHTMIILSEDGYRTGYVADPVWFTYDGIVPIGEGNTRQGSDGRK